MYTGPPQSPDTVNLVPSHDAINTTFMIRWSQSDCALEYVVAIINTSDDRVYPNITTNDNSTTVTLPTGVEFCVTVVGVDSISRRGSPSELKCYCKCVGVLYTAFHLMKTCCFSFLSTTSITYCQYWHQY